MDFSWLFSWKEKKALLILAANGKANVFTISRFTTDGTMKASPSLCDSSRSLLWCSYLWVLLQAGSYLTTLPPCPPFTGWNPTSMSELSQEAGILWLPRRRHSHLSLLLQVPGWATWLRRDSYSRWLSLLSWVAGSTQPQTAEERINNLSLPN